MELGVRTYNKAITKEYHFDWDLKDSGDSNGFMFIGVSVQPAWPKLLKLYLSVYMNVKFPGT